MLVPHIQHDSPWVTISNSSDDLDSFFEYVDEIVLSHADETPDNNENDGQLLDEVAKEEFCDEHHLPAPLKFNTSSSFVKFKKTSTAEYKQRISLDIIAPPPDFI